MLLRKILPASPRFTLSARWRSFKHALNGLRLLLVEQHNARLHAVCGLMVLVLGVALGLSRLEWLLVVFVIGWVISLEALNSALEYVCDRLSPAQDELIGKAKDVAAGAVLISAVSAALIGLVIFVPKVAAIWSL